MSNSLYLEAIQAAEQIKMSAEEKVKEKIIESISPQVKKMIESKLFEEESSNQDTAPSEVEEDDKEHQTKSDEEEKVELVSQSAKKNSALEKIKSLSESIQTLQKAIILSENTGNFDFSKEKVLYLYKNILKEIKNLSANSIIKSDTDILKEYFKLNKELENMSRRRSNRKYLNESLEDLLEMDLFEADEDDEDQEKDQSDEAVEEEADDSESPVKEEVDSLADLDVDDLVVKLKGISDDITDVASDLSGEEKDAAEDLDIELGDSDEEEEDELDLSDGIFEVEEGPDCDVKEDLDEEEDHRETYTESISGDRVLEIDENMLRREIGKMKALREGEAKEQAHHFGGGSVEGEVFVDGVELNKLHEMKIKAAKVIRKNRMLESKLSQYKKALQGMKGQLVEMNLFNAKLLYANKLMQNSDLSMKQQRHIVESLDEAKTLGEAKILFESLSKSLVSSQPARKGGNLTEGAIRRRPGSSSAPVRSGQSKPLNESVALDRWATLAGIKK